MKQIYIGKKIFGTTKETHFTSMTRKATLFITILMVISLLPQINALELTFDSPESVDLNEEFTVSFDADSSETHDVKIFVHNSPDRSIKRTEYISEIYGDDWKDPWYYIKEAFPETKEFKIRVIESPGDREICVRFRKTDSDSTTTDCNSIEVLEGKKQNTNEVEEETRNIDKEEIKEEPQKQQINNVQTVQLSPNNNQEKEKIILNSPTKLNNQNFEITTKAQTKRNWIIYSFLGLCVFIIVLLSLRRL